MAQLLLKTHLLDSDQIHRFTPA